VILLDAYALVAFFAGDPPADEVEKLLRGGSCAMNAVNLAESIDVLCRRRRLTPSALRPAVELLVETNQLELIVVDDDTAWRAAELRRIYYTKRSSELSLADCFLLAAAGPDDEIATADAPVAAAARAEAVGIVALPDSSGRRP
jgi:predicted nucleic acid-binding protein